MPYTGLITIGIPTWNRVGYLLRAVHSALNQTYTDLEIIVCDNASTDGTWDALQQLSDPRLKLFRQPANIGGIANINFCLQQATGELFLLLSDDDALEPTAIAQLSQPFADGVNGAPASSIGLVWSPYLNVDTDGKPLWATQPGPPLESSVDLLVGLYNGIRGPQLSSILQRTADTRRAGGYNGERYGALCDTGNWGGCALLYPNIACIPAPLMRYTVHSASMTGAAAAANWLSWAMHMHADFLAALDARGDSTGTRRLTQALNHHMANLAVFVLMRFKGKPGWISAFAREFWRSRRFMMTPFVVRRILRDGWKLLKLK